MSDVILTDPPKPSGDPPPSLEVLYMRCYNQHRELSVENDALATERDALLAYARRVEREYIVQHGDRTFWSDEEAWQRVAEEREKDGVAEIMAREDR